MGAAIRPQPPRPSGWSGRATYGVTELSSASLRILQSQNYHVRRLSMMRANESSGEAEQFYEFVWTDEILEHLAEHDLTAEDFESVVEHPEDRGKSASSGCPIAFGETADGRFILCAYDLLDDGITVIPRTAYDVPRKRKK